MKNRPLAITNVLLATLVLGVLTNPMFATATHQPADKVVAAGSKIVEVPITTAVTLETLEFKTSGPTDLMVHVNLECSIQTIIRNVGGGGVPTSTGEAEGQIRVWLEFDGLEVAIDQVSGTPQPSDPPEQGTDTGKTVFCNNRHKMVVTDAENPANGTDTYEQHLKTKTANAFNWIIMNTGGWSTSNIHTLQVKADFAASNIQGAGSSAAGFVGNRMVIVEPTKMSNHASV